MPPSKASRVLQEDSTPASLKEKLNSLQATAGRGRRNGAMNLVNGSSLKEVVSTADTSSTTGGQNDRNASGISWATQDTNLLHGYRRAYRLSTPSAFKNPLSHVVLGNGIGRYSPTMARPGNKRRVPKDQLALAVRKNFNALGVNETDVIVDLLYKVKNKDRDFRARFAPPRK